MQQKMYNAVSQLQKSNKEQVIFNELSNQVLELEKELHRFIQESENIVSVGFAYEKMVDSFEQIGISILEFQQDSITVSSQKQVSIRMKLTGSADSLLKIFYILKLQALFFIVKSYEIMALQNENNWEANLQGQLFYFD